MTFLISIINSWELIELSNVKESWFASIVPGLIPQTISNICTHGFFKQFSQ